MRTESAEVIVVGSGAGGAVIAHESISRGCSTILVERGPHVRGRDMSHDEAEMLPKLYKDGGLHFNSTQDMAINQASCVGGSTVLANNVMFRTPEEVLDEWEGLGAVINRADLARSFDKIFRTLGSGPARPENISPGSRLLMEGAAEIGLDPQWMDKALGGCNGCGGCNIGCVWEHKRSTLSTYIPWAQQKGARLLADMSVEQIEWKRGRVSSLVARQHGELVRLRGKRFVISAGAIGSSAILLKSGIGKNVGRRVSFNGGAMLIGEFPQPIDVFDGDQMTVYIKGDGYMIEPVHNAPASTAVMAPGWFKDHSDVMRRFRHLNFAGALVPTQPVGRVRYSHLMGYEETDFQLPVSDMLKLKRGLKDIARSYFAAGAERVLVPGPGLLAIDSPEDVHLIDDAFFHQSQFNFGSAHPQGGNALSDDPELGVIDHDFKVHGFDNLFVCDASVFPSGVRVNPIHSILSMADYAAPRILA